MEMTGEQLIAASQAATWEALNNPDVLKDCIPGCESVTRVADDKTMLLYFSGGPANPFTIFYFVNLALAAVVLPKRASWSLLLVAWVCLGFLFARHVPVPELTRPVWHGSQQQLALQHAGLVTAVALCAGVAVYFITRVTSELQRREEQLRAAE